MQRSHYGRYMHESRFCRLLGRRSHRHDDCGSAERLLGISTVIASRKNDVDNYGGRREAIYL